MRKVAVFGLGRFGSAVARTLSSEGLEVLAVDRDRALVDEIKDDVAEAVSFDVTDREALRRYEVGEMDAVIIGIGDGFEAAVMTTLLCSELGVEKIVCKALTPRQRDVLKLVGAHDVVLPEEQMGRWLAENLLHGSVVNLVELPEGYLLRHVELPREWRGKTLAELQLLQKHHISLVQVHRRENGVDTRLPLPDGAFQLLEGDTLDVIGPEDHLEDFRSAAT